MRPPYWTSDQLPLRLSLKVRLLTFHVAYPLNDFIYFKFVMTLYGY